MAIINRSHDASEQKDVFTVKLPATANGVTMPLFIMPYPCTIQSARGVVTGISGAPSVNFFKTAASGITLEAIGISPMIMASVGTSGVIGYSGLAAAGSTLLDMQANGVVMIVTAGGSGAAFDHATIELVVKKTQSVVSHNGISS